MDGDTGSLLLDDGFSFLIAVRLIRDNYRVVIGNYPTSLIGENSIRFIGYELFGLFVLLVPRRDKLGSRFRPTLGPGPFY